MTWRKAHPDSTHQRCKTCRAPVIAQRVGTHAALDVTADLTPVTPEQAAEITTNPDRLIWCLHESRWSPPRLTWTGPSSHPNDCPRPHLACHQCPPQEPTTLF